MNKKIKYIIISLFSIFMIAPSAYASGGVYNKEYTTDSIAFDQTNYVALYKMDSLAFGDSNLTISYTHSYNQYGNFTDSKCTTTYCLVIKQYDKSGNKVDELYIQNVYQTISANVIDGYLYMINTYYESDSSYPIYIEKYDSNLNKVAYLKLSNNGSTSTSDITINHMFMAAHLYGICWADGTGTYTYPSTEKICISEKCTDSIYKYSSNYYDYYDFYQIHEENNKIVVYSLYKDYLFDKDLKNFSSRDQTWIEKYGNGDDYSYNFIDDNNYLVSGSNELDDDNYEAFIKLYTDDKEVFNYTNNDYYSFYFPIKVDTDYVVLGLNDNDTTDILIIDEDGNLIKTITGYYWNLRKNSDGFMVTNIGTSVYNYAANQSGSQTVNTEVYRKNKILTKTDGNGDVSYIVTDDKVKFNVTPKDGYVLKSIKVTDAEGNVLEFNDYEFEMPNSDVTIEVIFDEAIETVVDNPKTGIITYSYLLIPIVLVSIFFIKNKNKFTIFKK